MDGDVLRKHCLPLIEISLFALMHKNVFGIVKTEPVFWAVKLLI